MAKLECFWHTERNGSGREDSDDAPSSDDALDWVSIVALLRESRSSRMPALLSSHKFNPCTIHKIVMKFYRDLRDELAFLIIRSQVPAFISVTMISRAKILANWAIFAYD